MSEKIKVLVLGDDNAAHTGFGTVIRNLFGPMASDPRLDLRHIALYPMKEDKPRVMRTIPAGGPPDDEYGIEALGAIVKAEGWPDIIFLLGDYWYWNKTLLHDGWKKANGCLSSVWYYVPFDGIQMTTICKKAYQSAEKLIAMSPFGAQVLPEYTERNDVVLLPHGFNAAQFPYKVRGQKKPFTFGVVSRNARRKNIWAIIQAYWDLPAEVDARLLLHVAKEDRVGGYLPAWIDFKNQVAAMEGKTLRRVDWTDGIGIERNGAVSTMAGVADDDMAGIYERIDCLVSAGREGFGLPYLEARASGCRLILPRYSAHASMQYPDTIYYDCPHTRPDPGAPDILDICPDPERIMQAMLEAVKSEAPGPMPETLSAGLQWGRLSMRLHSWIMQHGVSKKRIQAAEAKVFHAIPWKDLSPAKLGTKKRMAIVMPESQGDVLLCTSVAYSLKDKFPDHALDFITKSTHFAVLDGCPWIDQIVEFNPGIHHAYDKMLRIYDAYWTPYHRTQVAANWVNGGYGERHLVEVYADACQVPVGDFWLPQTPAPEEKRILTDYITFHPGSGSGQQALRWYPRWEEVLSAIKGLHRGVTIVQVGVKSEPLVDGAEYDLRGKTTPPELNWWIGGAKMHLGIDSYPTHVAGLLDVPVVALFSNTRPENTGPYLPNPGDFIAVRPRKNTCARPCHMLHCQITEDREGCMKYIMPEDVVASVKEIMR